MLEFSFERSAKACRYQSVKLLSFFLSYLRSGMQFVAGRPVSPALTSALYSLCLRRISFLRSGRFFKPRPLGDTPLGHWGPIKGEVGDKN